MSRLLTAAVAVPLLLAVILVAPAWVFVALVAVCAVIAYRELGALLRPLEAPLPRVGYLTTLIVLASYYRDAIPTAEALAVAFLLLGLPALARGEPDASGARRVLGAAFATFYLGALMGSVVGVRLSGPDASGRHWILFLLAVVMVGDAGAYYVGRTFGRKPLAPRLSPKKTVEGLAGGLAFSVAAAVAVQALFFPGLNVLAAGGLGLVLGLLGVAGDLFESFLKRAAGVKDTSSLLPGHGGILDRIDSILFAAPALLLALRWLGPEVAS